MKKRLLSIGFVLFLLVLTASLATVTASAETEGDFTYTVSDSEATITGYTGSETSLTIPSTLGGYSVTTIGTEAFCDAPLTSVVIPEGVKYIGSYAFNSCDKLSSLSLPSTLLSIGKYAFSGSTALKDLTIPYGVISIGEYAFNGGGVKALVIPASVTGIGEHAFGGCSSLARVIYNADCKISSIAQGTFSHCSSLQYASLPSSSSVLTTIYDEAFRACSSLNVIEIPEGVTTVSDSAFAHCKNLSTVFLPSTVKTLGSSAFWKSTGTSVTFKYNGTEEDWANITKYSSCLPNEYTFVSLKYVDYVALNKLSLKLSVGEASTLTATVYPNTALNKNVTWTSSDESVATVVDGVVTAKAAGTATVTVTTEDGGFTATCPISVIDFAGSEDGFSYEVTKGKVTIVRYTGSEMELELPLQLGGYPVTAIGNSAFNNGYCNIAAIEIPEGVTSIGNYAFIYQSNLAVVKIPASVTYIGDAAFAHCSELPNIKIPNGIIYIGNNAFYGCSALTEAIYDGSEEEWKNVKVGTSNEPLTDVLKIAVVTGVTLDRSEATLTVGDSIAFIATVAPSYALNQSVSWITSNPAIASVTRNGVITAKSAGVVKISAKTADGGFMASCMVVVKNPAVAVSGVSLNRTDATVIVGNTLTLRAIVAPTDATNKTVYWITSNPAIATVKDGVLTANSAGVVKISAKTADGGFMASCMVTVNNPPVAAEGVSLNKTDATVTVGNTLTLSPIFVPSDTTNKNVSWITSNPAIAMVKNGVITAYSAGVVKISAKTIDGGFMASCMVVVKEPGVQAEGVELNTANATVSVGDTLTLSATVAPYNATNKAVSWITSNPAIAMVKNGVITAYSAGVVKISAKTADGGFTAVCWVTVEDYICGCSVCPSHEGCLSYSYSGCDCSVGWSPVWRPY